MENKAEMSKRVEDATRYLDLDNLAISPQCGFASIDTGNPIRKRCRSRSSGWSLNSPKTSGATRERR